MSPREGERAGVLIGAAAFLLAAAGCSSQVAIEPGRGGSACCVATAAAGSGGAGGGAGRGGTCSAFAARVDYPTGKSPASVVLADLNGDGKLDLATANGASNDVSVLFGNGDGTFAAKVDSRGRWDPESIAAADLNGDGKPDLAVAEFGDGSENVAGVLLNHGDGTFAGERLHRTDFGAYSVAAADLNGDGRPDLVVVNEESDSVSVLLNRGDGTFAVQVEYDVGAAPREVAVADLDGDGTLDLAVPNLEGGSVSVLLNRGDGTFAAHVDFPAGNGPQSVAAADLNGDGKPDLAVTNAGALEGCGEGLSVLLNQGDGTFAAAEAVPTGANPEAVAAADLNGDGKLDLVVANAGIFQPMAFYGYGDTVSVLLGKGDGTFAAKVDYSTGRGPQAVAVGDIDGDGKPDLVVANRTDNTVSVLLACAP